MWGRPIDDYVHGNNHRGFYEQRFANEIATGLLKLFEGDSSSELSQQPDGHYDLIYIDGAHDFEGVKKDAAVAVQKVKKMGTLVFNDYIMFDHTAHTPYGIVPVVNDLCVNQGWRITHFALHTDMFCDVAICRAE